MSRSDSPKPPNRRDVLVAALTGVGAAALPTGSAKAAPPVDAALDADAQAMADVVLDSFNTWLGAAEYNGGSIHGVMLSGGTLTSSVDVAPLIEAGLISEDVDPNAAAAIASEVAQAWEDWANDWTMPTSRVFPDFAAVAGAEATVTEGDSVLLQPQNSGSFRLLKGPQLKGALLGVIDMTGPIKGDHPGPILVHEFAFKVGAQVVGWSAGAMIEGIFGSGPVPSFAPPYVPVGPVVAGDNIGGPAHLTKF